MQALLLIAHGSRRQNSNEEVKTLAETLAARVQREDSIVECAFLELADPSIPQGVASCIQRGATNILVLPYFLSAGRHVAVDIPAELEKARQQHPNVKINIAPYLGSADEISEILVSLSKQTS